MAIHSNRILIVDSYTFKPAPMDYAFNMMSTAHDEYSDFENSVIMENILGCTHILDNDL